MSRYNNPNSPRYGGSSGNSRISGGDGSGRMAQSNNFIPLRNQSSFDSFDNSNRGSPRRPAPATLRSATPARRGAGGYGNRAAGGGRSSTLSPPRPALKIPPQPISTVESTEIFFTEIKVINDLLKRAKDNVSRMETLQKRNLENENLRGGGDSAEVQKQMNAVTDENSILMDTVKRRVKAIELENARLLSNHPDLAVRTSQHTQLKKKFLDFLTAYNEVERDYRSQVKDRMERQIRMVDPNMSEAEVRDELEQRMQGGMTMMSQGAQYANASAALDAVQSRQNDIQRIEQTIIQLTQLFTEMSTLVEAQGQTIATIEQHVESTEQYTEQAVVELETAVVTAKKIRGRKWMLLLCVLLLLIIGGVALYLFVLKDIITPPTKTAANTSTSTASSVKTE